ncbi:MULTISPECIES: thiamine phosphate synthase [Thermococcus]|uniref:thiamine phosphate synthase n=1 Tax=Thermococcus TaxID=2263 RepID=UPI00064EE511|nr:MULTISPECIES: thiamine phosphate synthase [Thermococcus]KUK28915.1 MAG: Thiamine-phosphate synthase [Thermococcus sp. 40_45]MBC7094752.1 thiamine phosphate synthase [Thermococcus sp.]HII66500.1 thiamine phosphate synthase [Thermococcaceae archaeon]
MNLRKKLKLYVITDRRLKSEIESVREALEGGATSIQLRIKNAPTGEMIKIGKEIRELTKEYDALYFVDDRLDVALATDADGVQLGPEDMPISLAKEIGPNLIIGASVYSLEEALKAEKEGADYLGAGSVFPTPTKRDVKVIGLEGLKRIVESVKIPVVAIGGINHKNARDVLKTGVDGIAIISAIMGAEDVKRATEEMRKIIEEVLR